MSLTTGGAAQWGWDSLRGSGGAASELAVSSPRLPDHGSDGGTEVATPTTAPVSPRATSSARDTPAPGKRASRDADRKPAPVKPSASPTLHRPSTIRPVPPKPLPNPPPTARPSAPDRRTLLENEAIRLTNAERVKNGCKPLRADDRLRDASRGHSDDMRKRNYFDHTTPDGVDPWKRAKAEGYSQPTGENIARGQPTAAAVVEAWMNSEGHRANILNCDSKAIGIGVTLGSGGPWWTQMFGAV